jgi:hypothetical protein
MVTDVIKCWKHTLQKNKESREEAKGSEGNSSRLNGQAYVENQVSHMCEDCGLPDPNEKLVMIAILIKI